MSMNAFRLCGDMSHVFSIIILLLRLRVAKNAQGISLRTNELFFVVFVTRYLDLFTTFYSLYNSGMKILYIVTTGTIIYMIRFKEPICSTYDKAQDTFLHWRYAVAPCAVIATITHLIGSGFRRFELLELLWTFSIYLESIAILPQLIVLQRYREVENLTGNFIFFMGAYRAFYILNWIWRSYHEPMYQHHFVVYFCGVLQTLLYADFFYYYFKSKTKGGKFSLPTAHDS
uniref:ER lumen protein-retaining receptor n=2 Tax=Odontella aurita TaxID=265563 RepID=A0A7S4HZX9_9STRA|mmetsp:Transcript_177/g.416  ORF Transcript_177/g.416 Transcript_177/m.416 type:complete len:230 (+) Transcript_177:131-820(+)|eukprot:CAMPEP_0113595768 /NCGR_PEP_ID=MMETSP0015_2-20120614/39938_1 /TAXON_ID=2838 /ORGANISM="Odontella" /LENGTH=229 /DNA_ID=CAMNT_0000503157 /DNA_START=86 /DNA_END=775 /DNA_ORIENTATION=- /assembly_acc=CAM_ASM_000160